MVLQTKLQRRHTWPFELVEILCENHEVIPDDTGNNNPCPVDSITTRCFNGFPQIQEQCGERSLNHKPPNKEYHEDDEDRINLSERTTLLTTVIKGSNSENAKDRSKSKNKTPNGCTCSTKTSNNGNSRVALQPLSEKAGSQPASTSSNSLGSSTLGNFRSVGNNQNKQTSSSVIGKKEVPISSGESEAAGRDDSSNSGKKSPGTNSFYKFPFFSKKSKDPTKHKKNEKDRESSTASASSGSKGSTTTVTKHKDYCPHSKNYQKQQKTQKDKKSETNRNNEGGSNSNKEKDKPIQECFASISSNNNSPSHSQHSSHASQGISIGSCMGSSTQGILTNKGSSIASASGGSQSGSGIKGSVTIVAANIINCNDHHETEGKIPSANGTATGALSLQVNHGEIKKTFTLYQNYYPEGDFGWIVVLCAFIVQVINHGMQGGVSTLLVKTDRRYDVGEPALLGFLASVSLGVSLFLSPIWVALCKSKSTRLSGVFGGLITALGTLFTSFASQFHQLFLSYGGFVGVGVGLSRDASTLMVGQYFKRKRDKVEIILSSASGLGICLMGSSIHVAISFYGWILGLQAITALVLLTFFLGGFYRSASLYHPQRRAILHLKNQKKKVKDITKREEKPPFLDFSCLKSKTLQILLFSSAFISFGINGPLVYLGLECREETKEDQVSFVLLHVYVGLAYALGCLAFGAIVIQNSQECRVSKQYLCQVASMICGISIITFTSVKGNSGFVVFCWVYGFSLGAYNYALKVYTYERVRARHFPRAWSFVQWSQSIPLVCGVSVTGILNSFFGRKSGYYVSGAAVFIGSALLFLTDVRRRRLSRKKANTSSMKTCSTSEATQTPKMRRLSFAFPVEPVSPHHTSKPDSGDGQVSVLDPMLMSKELTCISEEGLGEIDFQDICFDDWAEFLGGDCITSCAKVENCLNSEYDQDFSLLLDKRNVRRWSRNSIPFPGCGVGTANAGLAVLASHTTLPLPPPTTGNHNQGSNISDTSTNHHNETLRIPHHQPGSHRESSLFRSFQWNPRTQGTPKSIIDEVIDEASV